MDAAPYIVNTSRVLQTNQKTILDYLRIHARLSCAELGRRLGVPTGTVSRVVGSLLDANVLAATKPRKRRGVGKPPTLLDVNEGYASLIGIEINEMSVRLALTDFKGKVLARETLKTPGMLADFERHFPTAVADFARQSRSVKDAGPLRGIGIGVSGTVSLPTGEVRRGFLPSGIKLNPLVEGATRVPVQTDNDANLAALGEQSFGAGREAGSIICLLDRGWVGTGILLNGALYRGANNAAGELGAGLLNGKRQRPSENVTLVPFIESCGLERRLRLLGRDDLAVGRFASRADMVKALRDEAEAGSSQALHILQEEAEDFACAFQRLAHLFDPDLLVLCGDLTAGGDLVEAKMRERFADEYLMADLCPGFRSPGLMFSRLGQDAVTLGAAAMMIEHASQSAITNGGD